MVYSVIYYGLIQLLKQVELCQAINRYKILKEVVHLFLEINWHLNFFRTTNFNA